MGLFALSSMNVLNSNELAGDLSPLASIYSDDIIRFLHNSINFGDKLSIADFSSYSGILSSLFLFGGYQVASVEATPNLRCLYESKLKDHPNFSIAGNSIRNNDIASKSSDLITVAESFGKFEPTAAIQEFRRIMKPSAHVLLLWTSITGTDPADLDCVQLVKKYIQSGEQHVQPTHDQLKEIFAPAPVICHEFEQTTRLSQQQLQALLLALAAPALSSLSVYPQVVRDIDKVFRRHQQEHTVQLRYKHRLCLMPNLSA